MYVLVVVPKYTTRTDIGTRYLNLKNLFLGLLQDRPGVWPLLRHRYFAMKIGTMVLSVQCCGAGAGTGTSRDILAVAGAGLKVRLRLHLNWLIVLLRSIGFLHIKPF